MRLLVKGHTLLNNGRILGEVPGEVEGFSSCSCGLKSPVFPSNRKRRIWHRKHKEDILANKTYLIEILNKDLPNQEFFYFTLMENKASLSDWIIGVRSISGFLDRISGFLYE